jgi:hypothetical protein
MKRSISSTSAWIAALAMALHWVGAPPFARAEVPDVNDLLVAGGFSTSDVEKAKAGEIIRGNLKSSNDRELVATLAFLVKEKPSELMAHLTDGLLMHVDRNVMAWEYVEGTPDAAALAGLELAPDSESRAKRYGEASIGTKLNLSPDEIATFSKLGPDASSEAVEPLLRDMLAARLAAYQKQGLAGIAPYAREDNQMRSPGDDLRSATEAAKTLSKWMPAGYKMILDYPASKVPGSKERFAWSQIDANGTPTIVLTHGLAMPDGDIWVVMQRQFYVSEGYNCEQALAMFLPVEQGTAVFYVNRTSTDQVSGFASGAKRSIGSKLLASQLEELYARVQK